MDRTASDFRHPRPWLACALMVAGILLFIAAAANSVLSLQQIDELAEQRRLRYRNLLQIEAVLSTLKDLESGQRGFLITGEDAFLAPYHEARWLLADRYQEMRVRLADVVLPADFWQRLDRLIEQRIHVAEGNIELRRAGRFEAHADLERLTHGMELMDAIRREFEYLGKYRQREIERISADLAAGRQRAFAIVVGAGILGLFLMLTALGLFLREQRRRLKAEAVLASANQRLETEVAARTQALRAALERIRSFAGELDRGIEAERRRLAREVHDQIGQIFTAMKLMIRPWSDRFKGEERLLAQFQEFTRLLDEGVNTARRITAELHPPLLDEMGLGAALEHFFTKYGSASGVACRVEIEHDQALDRIQATALFRIAQEALTNVLRHAGATRVAISDRLEGEAYRLVIEDDGRGLAASAVPSHGVRGMSERAQLVGGELTMTVGKSGGVRVEVVLPASQNQGSPS